MPGIEPGPDYDVPRPDRSRPGGPAAPQGPPTAPGPAAVLVVHGMGQQIPFETLDAVAEGLRRADFSPKGTPHARPAACTVIAGSDKISRLEMNLQVDAQGTRRDVHIYEAYWAPVTEGRVTLRDVVGFLLSVGWRSVRSGSRPFKRWLFNRYLTFPAPVRTTIYLAAALGVMVSLLGLSTMILGIVAARVAFMTPPPRLSPALFADITAVLTLMAAVFVVFGATVWASMWRPASWRSWQRRARLQQLASWPRWRGLRSVIRWASVLAFITALWSTGAGALVALLVLGYHWRRPEAEALLITLPYGPWVAGLEDRLIGLLLLAAAGLGVFLALRWLLRFTTKVASNLSPGAPGRGRTLVVMALAAVMAASLAAVGRALARSLDLAPVSWRTLRQAAPWALVLAATAVVRSFLVQYVGDVAAYVESQSLDRFAAMRQHIKDLVVRRARAIYGFKEYDDIVLVGHSLGSVVIYDALNQLLLEELQVPGAPVVARRTRLLLTFGSPLDKTAYLFGTQGPGREAREALAASVQPLISDPAARPVWINIFSPWDIISGELNFYDLPDGSNPHPVQNQRDPDAQALLGAHEEYWTGRAVFDAILAALTQ